MGWKKPHVARTSILLRSLVPSDPRGPPMTQVSIFLPPTACMAKPPFHISFYMSMTSWPAKVALNLIASNASELNTIECPISARLANFLTFKLVDPPVRAPMTPKFSSAKNGSWIRCC